MKRPGKGRKGIARPPRTEATKDKIRRMAIMRYAKKRQGIKDEDYVLPEDRI